MSVTTSDDRAGPGPDTALPSVGARAAAFVAVFVGAGAGAVIGFSFAELQCEVDGGCDLSHGLWLWIGSLVGAIGVAIVAVLTLRALGEWNTIRDRDAADQPNRNRR